MSYQIFNEASLGKFIELIQNKVRSIVDNATVASARSATKATQDSDGNAINTTYRKVSDSYSKSETDTKLTGKADSATLDAKQDKLTFDSEPTKDSTNAITSGGVYKALEGKSTGSGKTYTFTDDTATDSDGNTQAVTVTKVNGHTVNSDVPSGAKFTDTVTEVVTEFGNADETVALSKVAIGNYVQAILDGGDYAIAMLKTHVDLIATSAGISTPIDYSGLKSLASLGTNYDDDKNCFNVKSIATFLEILCEQIDANTSNISGKADSATTLSGYGITDGVTKGELNTAINGFKKITWSTITIATSAWSNNTATVSVSGVTADNAVDVAPVEPTFDAYINAGIRATSQGSGTLTFACETVPTVAISVNVKVYN